jgi:phosphatidylglycerol:prolipoprotein diacylglycerol transferase
MHPVLFRWRGVPVYSYTAMLACGFVAGAVVANAMAHRAGLAAPAVFAATILLLVPSLAGARLLFVTTHWGTYRRAPGRIWRRAEGGMAMYGGLPCAVAASAPLLRLLHVPFGTFWDIATFTILVGMIPARVGCLLNGCCAGRPTNHRCGVLLPGTDGTWQRRVPTQILEAGWAVVLLAGAAALWPVRPFAGALFLYLLCGYGAGRLAMQGLRDGDPDARSVRVPRFISAALVVIAVGGFVIARLRA